jgi:uncharacterized protein YbaA (DUF1428 family)
MCADGEAHLLPRSVKRKPNETVIFSYIVYKSRVYHDRVMPVTQVKRIADMMKIMTFPSTRNG